jgi:penicillin-binding protein-related factor A (putative recombinase)
MAFESSIQAAIIKYLKSKGAVVHNIQGNEYQSGVSDLLVCYRGRYIALEVKGPNGSLSPLQRVRLRRIQKAGGIGEAVHGREKVKEILKTIDSGEIWINGTY